METIKISDKVTIITAKKSERVEIVKATEDGKFAINRGGLGLPAGEYELQTAEKGEIFALKQILANDGRRVALPIIAGVVTSKDGKRSILCGLGAKDKNLVLPFNEWSEMEPDSNYSFTLNEKGYVSTIKLLQSEDDIVPESEVITKPSKKELAA